jgi:hypothetical protein
MDMHENEIKRIKALRFPRSSREATGSNFYAPIEKKFSWGSWIVFSLLIAVLIAIIS